MNYQVGITDSALRDMTAIYDYIADKLLSPETAKKQYDRIAEAIQSLEYFPLRCPVFAVDGEHSFRRLLIDKYSVFYLVSGNTVTVTSILYSASDLASRLKDLLEAGR